MTKEAGVPEVEVTTRGAHWSLRAAVFLALGAPRIALASTSIIGRPRGCEAGEIWRIHVLRCPEAGAGAA